MAFKPLKVLGKLIQTAAPAVLTVAAGPAAGAVAASVLGGTALVKKAGHMAEDRGLGRPHKIAAPMAAVGLPQVLGMIMPQSSPMAAAGAQITALLESLGVHGMPPMLVVGLLLWVSHQFGNNVEKSGG
ncbi:MAG: hypothetical protein DRJ03_29110 [Chloroflexi bacterium]|nr:MAG: hypothetical protein DRJ03_29110 [Chloroflexota bacterium]